MSGEVLRHDYRLDDSIAVLRPKKPRPPVASQRPRFN